MGSLFLRRFLSHEVSARGLLEFLQVIGSDPDCKLKPGVTDSEDPLHGITVEVRNTKDQKGVIAEYLADKERRAFAKMALLFLISSVSGFQPDRSGNWAPFDELLGELVDEGLILDPSYGAEPEPGDVHEYIIKDRAASVLKLKLHELRV